ncbi:glycosyltransferase [Acuticoccus yangtzensis]|uniref:glycosyltransferase n=1 Tax=Acuticoccus yangtzensis TaxID=1443441 RepID=UPI0009499068|nr:glycosyltransferase [Acuticoccus yangtzensis]
MTACNLFQFWNTAVPPEEVATLMAGWQADPGFTYRRFTTETADAYIAEHLGVRAVAAFRRCAVPAMQADFFRYCALFMEGGVYVDADCENGGGLPAYIAKAGRGLLMMRQVRVANDFLFVRAARDPLFAKVIEQAIENIEKRVSNNVWAVTGPGIMTAFHRAAATRSWFDGFEMRPVQEVREIVHFRQKLEYKSSAEDWRSNLTTGAPSIFKDLEDGDAAPTSGGTAAAGKDTASVLARTVPPAPADAAPASAAPGSAVVPAPASGGSAKPRGGKKPGHISVVVIGYRMRRELPRTILSLSPDYQRIDADAYDIALSEMPSDAMLTEADIAAFPANLTYTAEPENLPLSVAVNRAVRRTTGDHVLLCVDGARILSPGILQRCRQAIRIHPRGVVAVHGMHLGARPQQDAVPDGTHDAAIEDALLASIAFPKRPYQLFSIACWAGSSRGGWFAPMAESCALMVAREHFEELGGFDEKVTLPGGGLANSDFYSRAVATGGPLFVPLGEATFHQHHGGTTTSARVKGAWGALKTSFAQETGRPFALAPDKPPYFLGNLPRQTVSLALDSLIDAWRSEDAARPLQGMEALARLEATPASSPGIPPSPGAPSSSSPEAGAEPALRHPMALVVGMHRSGTSFLTRQMVANGFAVPGTSMGGTSRSNPEGHFEPLEIVAWHNRLLATLNLSWSALGEAGFSRRGTQFVERHGAALRHVLVRLEAEASNAGLTPAAGWVVKDPRLCRLMPVWQAAFAAMGSRPAELLVLRDPSLVAESLKRRDGFDLDFGRLLWARHVAGLLERATTAQDLLCLDGAKAADVAAYMTRRTGVAGCTCAPVQTVELPAARDPITRLYRAFLADRDLDVFRTALRAELDFLDRHPGLTARLDRLAGFPG